MKRAVCLIKPLPHYRRDSFVAGLQRLGYTVVHRIEKPGPDDVLVVWNLTGGIEREAERFKRGGAKVLVAENGYLTPPGVPGMYAISEGGHNGAGRFPVGGPERWRALGVELKPWRQQGKHILVCGQRGIGSRAMASPHGWHQKTAEKLQRVTRRPVRVRAHPGGAGRGPSLASDLRDAWAVVIWSSAVGVRALVEGIPVLYAAPHWICSTAASHYALDIDNPPCDDARRLQALEAMAWGQWHHQEIATGEPLRGVLEC